MKKTVTFFRRRFTEYPVLSTVLVVVIGAILAMFVHGVMVYDDPIARTGAAVAFLFCVWRTVKMIRDVDDGEGGRRSCTEADGN